MATEERNAFCVEFGSHPLKGEHAGDIDVMYYGYTEKEVEEIVRTAHPTRTDKHIDMIPAGAFYAHATLLIPIPCGTKEEDYIFVTLKKEGKYTLQAVHAKEDCNNVSSILRGFHGDCRKILERLNEVRRPVNLVLKESGDDQPLEHQYPDRHSPSMAQIEENLPKIRKAASRLPLDGFSSICAGLWWGWLLDMVYRCKLPADASTWVDKNLPGKTLCMCTKDERAGGKNVMRDNSEKLIETDLGKMITRLYGGN